MYLKNIEVHGFKSFAQKINFEFHNGITGIVGPNGSGKSNVGDAVRWVLGEQSAKQLRGGNMQDVIFSGTETRKPLSFASVAITLDNSDHKLPVDFNEVTVTRRLYRSGESEYLINGSACRLKDINEMFYDTGIGKEDLYGNSDAFIGAMKTHMRALHMSALYTSMNELSNHDHSRFLTRTNRRVGRISYAGAEAASQNINPAVMREGVVVQMTWPGAPTVYYGDEAGVCGFTDPDNRRTYPWGHEDQMMIAFHRDMIKIHKEYDFLSNGSLVFLWNDYQGLCFGRFSHDERMIVILNNRNEDREVEIEVWKTGISRLKDSVLKRIMLSYRDGYTTEEYEYTAKAGVIRVPMPAFGAMVLYHKCENPTIFVED